MALITQDDTGQVADANGYGTVTGFKDHHDARGNAYDDLDDSSDEAIEAALVRTADYIDSFAFIGSQVAEDQTTAWPRKFRNSSGTLVSGIPVAIERAAYEYAFRSMQAPLQPDPLVEDASGMAIRSKSVKVGPVEESVEYDSSGGLVTIRSYPVADGLLVPYLAASGRVVR
jgi:hypothetical protein